MFAKADIVVTDLDTGEIDIYEVKSGTKAKEDYQTDLAFQCFVAEQAGYKVRNAYLIFLDKTYVFDGRLDTERLFKISDETDNVRNLLPTISSAADAAMRQLNLPEPPVTLTTIAKTRNLNAASWYVSSLTYRTTTFRISSIRALRNLTTSSDR